MGINLHKNSLAKQAWFTALFIVALLLSASHSHEVEDISHDHECTICSVASHLDDADTPQAVEFYSHQLTKTFLQNTFTATYSANLISTAARGPPLS